MISLILGESSLLFFSQIAISQHPHGTVGILAALVLLLVTILPLQILPRRSGVAAVADDLDREGRPRG